MGAHVLGRVESQCSYLGLDSMGASTLQIQKKMRDPIRLGLGKSKLSGHWRYMGSDRLSHFSRTRWCSCEAYGEPCLRPTLLLLEMMIQTFLWLEACQRHSITCIAGKECAFVGLYCSPTVELHHTGILNKH